MRDPIATVHKIYAAFDLSLSGEAEQRMRRFLAENPQGKHGAHTYSLQAFGLDEATERRRYQEYCARFGL
jgi:hypothetical protein